MAVCAVDDLRRRVVVGLVCLAAARRGGGVRAAPPRRIILLWAAFVIPYHLIWWWQFTYQSRYLLTSLPMYAALAGFAVDWFATRVTVLQRVPAWAAVAVW